MKLRRPGLRRPAPPIFRRLLLAAAAATLLASCGGGGYTPSPASVTERRPLAADFLSRRAVNYSPYRTSASPEDLGNETVTAANVRQDLRLLRSAGFGAIRLFSSRAFGQTVLDVIRSDGLDIKVMLGCYPTTITAAAAADAANATERANQAELDECIRLANVYSDIVQAVSVGNETMVSWATNAIPAEVMGRYLRKVRGQVAQPVTTDDNWAFWAGAPKVITDVVDFASVHTYTLLDTFYDPTLWDWRQKAVPAAIRAAAMMDAAAAEAGRQFLASRAFLDRIGLESLPMIVGETGWVAVDVDGDPSLPMRASPVNQKMYFDRMQAWSAQGASSSRAPGMVFTFQAFDEPWKGADDGWGLFNKDRQARWVVQDRGTCGVTWTCEPGSWKLADALHWVPPDYSEPPVASLRYDVFTDAVAAGLRTDPFARTVGAVVADASSPAGGNVLTLAPTPENYGWGFFFRADPTTDTSPTPTENLSAFAGGTLEFLVRSNGYPGSLQVGISTDTDDRDVVQSFVKLSPGDRYGYCNTGAWCRVSIPLAAFVEANPRIDLRLVVFRFTVADLFEQTGKPLDTTNLPPVSIDDVHWRR